MGMSEELIDHKTHERRNTKRSWEENDFCMKLKDASYVKEVALFLPEMGMV